jgi:signal transduction histidine kinase
MDDIFRLLAIMIDSADEMLLETDLNDLQRKFINGIFHGAVELRDLFLSFPDFTMERAREVVNFETRSQLSGIIGYAEVLLDETEGDLNAFQRAKVHDIRSAGKELLRILTALSES